MAAKINFEKSMTELEEIVKKLEDGDTTLDESLSLFERGVKLSAQCSKLLDAAEQKVNVLLKDAEGDMKEEAFLPNEEE